MAFHMPLSLVAGLGILHRWPRVAQCLTCCHWCISTGGGARRYVRQRDFYTCCLLDSHGCVVVWRISGRDPLWRGRIGSSRPWTRKIFTRIPSLWPYPLGPQITAPCFWVWHLNFTVGGGSSFGLSGPKSTAF
jgi:hypothetical protein